MINPHAILLKPENFPRILEYSQHSEETLSAVYYGGANLDLPYYVVVQRNSVGLPYTVFYTKEELELNFNLSVEGRFLNNFERI